MPSVLSVIVSGLLAVSSAIPEKRLIEFARNTRVWLTEEQIQYVDDVRETAKELGVGYFDVTEFQEPVPKNEFVRAFPTAPSFQSVVNPLLNQSSSTNLKEYVTSMANFNNRYYTTNTGVESAVWIKDKMESFILGSGRSDASCQLFNHTWAQPSVICTIEGTTLANEVIVTGAHLDSINSRQTTGRSPGADDDATGVASFMEGFRILLNNGFKPKRRIDFIGYAAEEVGLRGSQDIARAYAKNGVKVYAVYQNEMSGYKETSQGAITILQDFVNADLTKFLESLVPEYLDIPLKRAMCGYGCSDHASWDNLFFPAVCTAEAGPFGNVNPNMHTDKDTVDNLDFNFTNEFSKLNLAFLVELSLFQ